MSPAPTFLAACWTSAGDVMPLRGPDTSPLDIRTRIEAVGRTGYTGFGLTRADLLVARETVGLETVASLLRDNGIDLVQLELIDHWWTTGESKAQSDALRSDLFEACPVLGVDNIKVAANDDDTAGWDQLCAGFDALADAGREAGVRIGYENTPFAVPLLRSTEQAIKLVTDVGNDNGGVILDIWHAYRGGTTYADIVDLLPPEYLFGVELDDGADAVVGSQIEDTFDNRLLCGTGVFDVPTFIGVVQQLGWTGAWGIEHMSIAHRRLPVQVGLQRALDAARACFPPAQPEPGPESEATA